MGVGALAGPSLGHGVIHINVLLDAEFLHLIPQYILLFHLRLVAIVTIPHLTLDLLERRHNASTEGLDSCCIILLSPVSVSRRSASSKAYRSLVPQPGSKCRSLAALEGRRTPADQL